MTTKSKHPGFAAVSAAIAQREGLPPARADAILAASARKASKNAVKKNQRLKKVRSVNKS